MECRCDSERSTIDPFTGHCMKCQGTTYTVKDDMVKPQRIGIYGGSFNPLHIGHLMSIAYVLSTNLVDQIVVAPCFEHAHGKDLLDFKHRMVMCKIGLSLLPSNRVLVSPVEATLPHPNRTINLIGFFKTEFPDFSYRLMIGSDVHMNKDKWYKWDEIVKVAPPLILGRDGFWESNIRYPIELPGISSSDIRASLKKKEDVSRYVPAGVLDYIKANKLYAR